MTTILARPENLEDDIQLDEASIPATQSSRGNNSSNLQSDVTKNNWEIYRIISFPDSLSWYIISLLAKLGFYYFEDNAICHFCKHRVDLGAETDGRHDCSDQIRRSNVPLPDNNTDYRYETNRIISFLRAGWCKEVATQPIGALDLARWGFYYTGENDAARCNFCRLEVRGWQRGDHAYSEHMRWNPHCPFISGRKHINIKLEEETQCAELSYDCAVTPRINNGEIASIDQSGSRQMPTAKHPEYSSSSSRLGSFNAWPLSMTQRPNVLSQSGFYYTGKGDRVICYQCGGGLKDWGQNDDPWVEHAVWFPRCAFLNATKGTEFIEMVQRLKNMQSTSEIQNAIQDVPIQNLNIENEASSSDVPEFRQFRQCKVCLDKELGIVFLPCGHLASCVECAPQLSCCPICRGTVTAYVRAFLP